MKIEYAKPNKKGGGPRYFLRPESAPEMRFLTILRDLAEREGMCIRVVGSQKLGQQRPGLPQDPVIALGLELEPTGDRPPEKQRVQHLDPNETVKPSRPSKPSRPGRGKLRGGGEWLPVGGGDAG